MGRPLTEHSILAAFRISPALLEQVDDLAMEEGTSRSEMLRSLLEHGVALRVAQQKGAA